MATDAATSTLPVDVNEIDWDSVFDHADNGKLGIVERRDALRKEVDAISTEEQVEELISLATNQGVINTHGNGEISRCEFTSDCVEPSDVDWQAVADQIPDEELPEQIESRSIRLAFTRVVESVESFDDAIELERLAKETGEIYQTGGKLALSNVDASSTQFDANAEADDEGVKQVRKNASKFNANGESPENGTVEDFNAFNALSEIEDLRAENEELRKQNRDLQARVGALSTQIDRLTKIVAGEESLSERLGDSEDAFTDLISRVEGVEDEVRNHEDMLAMHDKTDGSRQSPDERAVKLRQILTNEAERGDKARLTRAEAEKALGGGCHRETVLDAMKRAADGEDSQRPDRPYSEINGSSDLQPVEAITFNTSRSRSKQSSLEIDLSNSTHSTLSDLRKNLTTQIDGAPGVQGR